MRGGRVQRQIDRLLDEAEQAMVQRDWEAVRVRCEAVLRLDPENRDAAEYLAAANRDVSAAPGAAADPPRPPASPLPSAFVNGRFRVRGLLGEGGKKVVYRAHDTRLDRDVAFALLKTDGLDADGRARLAREARTLGRLSGHPHIVTVFEAGTDNDRPYLVAELMEGGDLARLIA